MVTETKTVQIAHVWDKAAFDKPRNMVRLAEQEGDIRLALNCYSPGDKNEMHYHVGTGQSFLVLKGPVTMRSRYKDEPKSADREYTLNEGDCILIPADVYYQMENPGPHQAILYQVKQMDAGEISVEGKGTMKASEYFTDALRNSKKITD
jgi:mannose-6-phosphate isomerase-like protein (cupin superfamily)